MHITQAIQIAQQHFEAACAHGNVQHMRAVLYDTPLGASVDTHAHNDAPFHLACASNDAAAVAFMLCLQGTRFIDNQDTLHSAFLNACRCGLTNTVALLLRCTGGRRIRLDADNHAAFLAACDGSHTDVVRMLLDVQDGRVAASRSTLSIAFARCVRTRRYPVAKFLQHSMPRDSHAARRRKISLHSAVSRGAHPLRNDARYDDAPFLGVVPPLVRCEPQDPPSKMHVHAALRRHAGLLVNALPVRETPTAAHPVRPAPHTQSVAVQSCKAVYGTPPRNPTHAEPHTPCSCENSATRTPPNVPPTPIRTHTKRLRSGARAMRRSFVCA